MVLRGEVLQLTKEEYKLSGLQAKEILDSGNCIVSDLRETFGVSADEIHKLDPHEYDVKKLAEMGFMKVDFVERSLMKGNSTQHSV